MSESKVTAIEAAKKIPGETDPLPKPLTPEEVNALADDLLNGKVAPSNEFAAYFIDKIKTLAQEGIEAEEVNRQLVEKQTIMQQRLMAIRFEVNAYQKDLVEWQRRGEKK